MRVHLVDGTYELFRHYFAVPEHTNREGLEVGATRAAVTSLVALLEQGATHVGVASDHVVESFRNRLWPGYKTGAGIEPALRGQFEPFEDALRAAGFTVWAMADYEADDALAAAAAVAEGDPRVEQVLLCSPDKDLAQCVSGSRVVQLDRRRRMILDAAGVRAKFGVAPARIPDWLALVGDAADGFPGLPGWGAKSAAAVIDRYGRLEEIPLDSDAWDVKVRGAARLAATFAERRDDALLFRTLATLVRDGPAVGRVDDWRWTGADADLAALSALLDAPRLARRLEDLAESRS